jgi:1-acyl-sn-glycerol-3-phosphate acyltransferase
MPRLLRILVTGSAFLVYSALGALIGYVILPLARLGGRNAAEKLTRCQTTLHVCSRIYVRYMELVGILRLRPPPIPAVLARREPCVVIANHPSLLDVIMMLCTVPGLVFLAKSSWFRSPFIAPLVRLGGHIPGPPEDGEPTPMDGALVLERILERLRQGFPVLVFPEGTRSPPGRLRPFQRGAFEAAIRAHVPLVGYCFRVDPPSLLKDQAWYDVPGRRINYDIDVLFVLSPEEFPDSARALRQRAVEAFESALGFDVAAGPHEGSAGAANAPGSGEQTPSTTLASEPSRTRSSAAC